MEGPIHGSPRSQRVKFLTTTRTQTHSNKFDFNHDLTRTGQHCSANDQKLTLTSLHSAVTELRSLRCAPFRQARTCHRCHGTPPPVACTLTDVFGSYYPQPFLCSNSASNSATTSAGMSARPTAQSATSTPRARPPRCGSAAPTRTQRGCGSCRGRMDSLPASKQSREAVEWLLEQEAVLGQQAEGVCCVIIPRHQRIEEERGRCTSTLGAAVGYRRALLVPQRRVLPSAEMPRETLRPLPSHPPCLRTGHRCSGSSAIACTVRNTCIRISSDRCSE